MSSLIELIRSTWPSLNETERVNYLHRLRISCDQHVTSLLTDDQQYHELFAVHLISILDLLHSITSSDFDLSIKTKLVLLTSLAWLIKRGQINYCRKQLPTICTTFKNILRHGQSNDRQLAVGDFNFVNQSNRSRHVSPVVVVVVVVCFVFLITFLFLFARNLAFVSFYSWLVQFIHN
jgi:hypothetical protein